MFAQLLKDAEHDVQQLKNDILFYSVKSSSCTMTDRARMAAISRMMESHPFFSNLRFLINRTEREIWEAVGREIKDSPKSP